MRCLSKLRFAVDKVHPFSFYLIFYFIILHEPFLANLNSIIWLVDTFVPNIPPKANIDVFVSCWAQLNFGQPYSGPLILPLVYGLSKLFGVTIAQRIIIFSVFVISTISMHLFLEKTNLVSSKLFILITSIIYGINGVVLKNFFATGIMFIYATAPLVMLFTFRLLFSDDDLPSNILGLSFSLFLSSLINFQGVFLMIPLITSLFLAYLLSQRRSLKNILFRLARIIVSLGFYILLILPVFYTHLDILVDDWPPDLQQIVKSRGISIEPVRRPIYQVLYPNPLSVFLIFSQEYTCCPISTHPLNPLAFILPIIVIFSLFTKEYFKRAISLSFISSILLINGWILLIKLGSNIPNQIISKSVFLAPFAGPVKLMIVTSPLLCTLIPIGLNEISKKITNKFSSKTISIFLLLTIILLIIFPIITYGNFLVFNLERAITPHSMISGQGGTHEVTWGNIPQYAIDMISDFQNEKTKNGPFRVLFVPQEANTNYYRNLYMESGIFPSGNDIIDKYIEYVVHTMSEYSHDKNNMSELNLSLLLKPLNIKYIVVLKNYKQRGEPRIWYSGDIPEYIVGDPKLFESIFDRQEKIVKIKETDDYIIYKNKDFLPLIFVSKVFLNKQEITSYDWEEISNEDGVYIRITEMNPLYSPSQYKIYVKVLEENSGPYYIYFFEQFNKDWNTYIIYPNGEKEKLTHFKAMGWANGFYLENKYGNEFTLELINETQNLREFILILWIAILFISYTMLLVRTYQKK